ncbi:MAG: type II secretion system protein GspM [Burkholderiaceae bacterium]
MNRASLTAWWQGLAPRERMLVCGGAALLLAVVVYLTLWEPPAQGIRKLGADLPELRSQDATMRAMAAEAASLRAVSGSTATIAPADRVAAVQRSLQRAGLWREGAAPGVGRAADSTVASTVSTLSVGGTVTTVATSAATRSDPPEITAEANDRVKVRFDDIDYGVWIAWLASTEGELSARAAKVAIVALAPKAPVGHVRAEALLDWTQPSVTPRQ